MSTYDDASLVLVPSGYKNGVVFSQKPMDANGQLTFTRASDATRVGPNGYIEKVRTNVFTYSEAYDNAAWGKTNMSVTANASSNPLDGASTAENLVPNTTLGGHYISQTQSVTAGVPFTISVYAKGNGYDWIYLYADGSGSGQYRLFNVSNGTLGLSGGTATSTITSVGDGWYRCTMSWVPIASGSLIFQIAVLSSNAVGAFAGDGTSGAFIWGAQLELGDIATDYIATTTAAVSVGPVSGTPRLDYLNVECPRLLLEPQRSNVQVNSERFNASGWNLVDAAIASNAITAPDGYNGADKMYATGGNSRHINYGVRNSSGTFVFSVFAKAGEKNWLYLRLDDDTPEVNTWFNLSTGTIGTSQGGNPTITPYGNGWYRCSVTYTAASTETIYNVIGVANANGEQAWTPSGTDGLYIWGAQVEAGAYATSYIPTLGTSVTRVADLAQKTSASALIGQTEGTIFWEFEFTTSVATANEALLNIDNGSFGNTVYITKSASGGIVAEMYSGGVLQASLSLSSQPAGTYKAAIGYANNNTAFFVNGVQVGTTDTSCSVPAMNRIQLGNGVLGPSTDKTAQVLLFPTRLTNAQLAQLTTL